MRSATLTCVIFVALGYAATAQKLSILPQIGIENSRTKLQYNDLPSFLLRGGQVSPQLAFRLDYKFNQGHGPFLGIATNRSVVSYRFDDPESAMSAYKTFLGDTRLRLDAGYQFSTKRFYFHHGGSSAKPTAAASDKAPVHRNCGSYSAANHCGKNTEKTKSAFAKNNSWYMVIQPSLGAAFIPASKASLNIKSQGGQTIYEYQAGNWKSALIAGTSFEFGTNRQRKFTLSINYLRGIGNLGTETITSTSGNKTTLTNLKSNSSGWSFTAGIPITLYQKKTMVKQRSEPKTIHPCEQYRMKCRRTI